jgi:hypothetical protein
MVCIFSTTRQARFSSPPRRDRGRRDDLDDLARGARGALVVTPKQVAELRRLLTLALRVLDGGDLRRATPGTLERARERARLAATGQLVSLRKAKPPSR